jgi:dephospho-CoA kinase
MRKIGLTGGIGSGKSTVAQMLAGQGACVIDADAISKAVTQVGGTALPAISDEFGAGMIAPDGGLDRDAMRQLMLQDKHAKAKLERIIHPLVGSEINAQLASTFGQGVSCAVLDIPLLAEGGSHWRNQLDRIWVVDCLPATQAERVQQRSGWPLQQIEAVMAAQASRAERLACADAVIFNEGLNLKQLEHQVLALFSSANLGRN